MIILDEEDQLRTKQLQDPFIGGPTLRFPEKVAGRSDSPLPDYETSEARQKLIVKENYLNKRVDPRLWRAIIYALGIYVLLSIIIGVPIVMVKKNKDSDDPVNFGPGPIWDGDDDPGASISLSNSDPWVSGDTAKCEWDFIQEHAAPTYVANVRHTLNYSGSFYIQSNISRTTSNSSYAIGNLTVDTNPNPSAGQIVFLVDVKSSSKELLHATTACFDESGGDRGLFVYISRKLKSTDYLGVNIQVLFPKNEPPRRLDNFVTYLPGFSHAFGDLANHTTFDTVVLEGSGYDVVSKSLKADKISIKNSYGSILGAFHAVDSLSLDGIKGNIITNITLEHDVSGLNPSFLSLDTGDGAIDAFVTLVASSPRLILTPSPYTFVADAKTFNGPLKIQVVHSASTRPMPLQLTVQNNDGETNVILDKNYEGTFNAQSKLGKVVVRHPYLPPSADPTGAERSRSYEAQQESPNRIRGWIGWGKRPVYGDRIVQGQIKVVSSLSPITLQFAYGS